MTSWSITNVVNIGDEYSGNRGMLHSRNSIEDSRRDQIANVFKA